MKRGTIVLVSLDPTKGHKQRRDRPCVVVTNQAVSSDQRFPMLAVVPLTGTPGEGALYPGLLPGPSGLRQPSWALIDQIRAVDKRRVITVFGLISSDELADIDDGMRLFLGLV